MHHRPRSFGSLLSWGGGMVVTGCLWFGNWLTLLIMPSAFAHWTPLIQPSPVPIIATFWCGLHPDAIREFFENWKRIASLPPKNVFLLQITPLHFRRKNQFYKSNHFWPVFLLKGGQNGASVKIDSLHAVHSHAKGVSMSNTRLHLRSTAMAKILRLCMHSHEKKIEMCNACVYQRSTGMAGVGFWSDLTSEGQFNSLYRLENVCFWTFVRQSLFICATLFFRLPFPSFGFWGEGGGVGWEASGRVEKTTFQ